MPTTARNYFSEFGLPLVPLTAGYQAGTAIKALFDLFLYYPDTLPQAGTTKPRTPPSVSLSIVPAMCYGAGIEALSFMGGREMIHAISEGRTLDALIICLSTYAGRALCCHGGKRAEQYFKEQLKK